MACLIGLFTYGVGWVGGEPVVTNFQNAATDFSQQEMANNTNTSRKEIWSATWRMIKAHPLAGEALGATGLESPRTTAHLGKSLRSKPIMTILN